MNLSGMLSRLATFAVVVILSFLLLTTFPFYPLYVSAILALVLGALAFEFAGLSLILAALLSVFAAMYQDPYLGMIFFVVFIIFSSVGQSWTELALIAGSWVFLSPSLMPVAPLAIVPTIIAGLHLGRTGAIKIGAFSAVSFFLLAWAKGAAKVGLMLIPLPVSTYVPKMIPSPWSFGAFLPDLSTFTSPAIGDYMTELTTNLSDVRVLAVIAGWAIGGYVTALLLMKWKKLFRLPPSIVGAVPVLAVSLILAGASPLDLTVGIVGVAIAAVAYSLTQSVFAGPGLGVFKQIEDLVPSGIPNKYSLLVGSPVCEERNLLIEQFLQEGIKSKAPMFLLSSDMDFAKSVHARFGDKMTVLVANPRADTMTGKNIVSIPTGIQNLTTLNIELVKSVRGAGAATDGRVFLDVLSDILLTHKVLTTRKWVTDLVPRLDEWGFTAIGTFNPVLHAAEEARGLTDLFKGHLEIFDKDFAGKTRKVIVVRKMTNLQFNESELILDKETLRRKETKGGLRGRLR